MVALKNISAKNREWRLYRRRLIPDEIIFLDADIITTIDVEKNFLVTTWHTIKPRSDFSKGCSVYYFSKGIKISKFFRQDNHFSYYYCDIFKSHMEADNKIICTDLLADVKIYPDNRQEVLDLDEYAVAHRQGSLSTADLLLSLDRLAMLLDIINKDAFYHETYPVDAISPEKI